MVRLYKKWNSIWQSKAWFLLPSVLGVGAFAIFPFVQVLVRSFSGGLAGYRTVLENEAFHLAVKNTCRFVGVGIPLLLLLSFEQVDAAVEIRLSFADGGAYCCSCVDLEGFFP